MCGRSAKLARTALPLALFLISIFNCTQPAVARKHNFATGSNFALGFQAGGETPQLTAFAAGTSRSKSSFSHYFLFQPQIDLQKVVLQLYAGWHFYPATNGAGTDNGGSFVETSQSGNLSYGGRMLLVPWINKTNTQRGYLALGLGLASVKLQNTRSYRAGSVTNIFSENVKGTGLEMQAGLGYEVMLLQNYSLSLEGGYAQRNIHSFKHTGTNDVAGAAKSSGDEALDSFGQKKGFHVWGPYVQVGFTLHL
jgi:hypothetical protein